jgi:hypothetical protein
MTLLRDAERVQLKTKHKLESQTAAAYTDKASAVTANT